MRYHNFYYEYIPLLSASLMMFGAPDVLIFNTIDKKFYDFDLSKIKRFLGSVYAGYIERDYFFELWKKISDYEVIISAYHFRKMLNIDKNVFNNLIDKKQAVKGLRSTHYKYSYVNKILKDNKIILNNDNYF